MDEPNDLGDTCLYYTAGLAHMCITMALSVGMKQDAEGHCLAAQGSVVAICAEDNRTGQGHVAYSARSLYNSGEQYFFKIFSLLLDLAKLAINLQGDTV